MELQVLRNNSIINNRFAKYEIHSTPIELIKMFAIITFVWIALNSLINNIIRQKREKYPNKFKHIKQSTSSIKIYVTGVVHAFIWGITYFFIRRYANPDIKDIYKFTDDAIYGSFAALAAVLVKPTIQNFIDLYI
jgi:hypothetical protein